VLSIKRLLNIFLLLLQL